MTSYSFSILALIESSSGSMALTFHTESLKHNGLKPRGTSAVSVCPRKSQTFYASTTRATWNYTSLLRLVANS
jgi:hypothetical protein